MPDRLDLIWDPVRAELRRATSEYRFRLWLEPLELAHVSGHTLHVRAPERIRTSVCERYLPLIRHAARQAFHPRATVEMVDGHWAAPAERDAPGDGPPARLNPKYTFDQFVIGEENRFAHAAALAVAELPAHSYNPLFVHGSPGLGKTHLLHAVGNYVGEFGTDMSVRYATIEEFTSAFVEAVRERRTAGFKDRFRGADVVLIDDVQFLAGREKTREEFFHTFNSLLGSGRQLVMTSDRRPEDIPGLEERLIERFRAGLVVELEAPALPARRAILHKRALLDGVELPDEVLDEIALRATTSVRALEGALIRVVAYASLRGEAVTPGLARHVMSRLGGERPDAGCGIAEILDAAAGEFGVERQALLARDRRPLVATARQVAMFLARELTPHSLPEIGRGMGGRSHTTVLHAVNRVSAALRSDAEVRQAVDNLRTQLGGRA